MFSKIIILCAQAFLMQSITAQYIGNAFVENTAWSPSYSMPYGAPVQYAPAPVPFAPAPVPFAPASVQYSAAPVQYAPAPAQYAPAPYSNNYYTYNPASLSASNACGLAVSSSSPYAPVGVSMMSENAFEGPLAVAGQMPFLGAIGVEGNLPTSGAGTISYNCGNGQIAILAEDLGYGYPGYSYGAPGYAFEGYY